MTQLDKLLQKFRQNGNVLTTAHFTQDRELSAEYRRLLSSDLKRIGYSYIKRKLTRNLFEYRLVTADKDGQLRFA